MCHFSYGFVGVSIRAPHAGSDLDRYVIGRSSEGFNPRSPRGERCKGRQADH